MHNNYFLTGKHNIGKSTIIRKLAKTISESVGIRLGKPLAIGGYSTLTGKKADADAKVYLAPFGYDSAGSDKCVLVGERIIEEDSFVAIPEIFDTYGVNLLNKSMNADLIIMDELGFMENGSNIFQRKVIEILKSNTPVLGAIKKDDTPFLSSIRKLSNTTIYELTGRNNDEVETELMKTLTYLLAPVADDSNDKEMQNETKI